MIAGKSTPDQRQPVFLPSVIRDLFQRLIDRLVEASIDYLSWQIEAGVEAVQIFDTWAGVRRSPSLSGGVRLRSESLPGYDIAIRMLASSLSERSRPSFTDYAACTRIDALSFDSTIDPHGPRKPSIRGWCCKAILIPWRCGRRLRAGERECTECFLLFAGGRIFLILAMASAADPGESCYAYAFLLLRRGVPDE